MHSRLDHVDTLKEVYEFGIKLGQGSFGSVLEVVHLGNKEHWACKTIHKEKAGTIGVRMLEVEIAVLKQVEHPNIVFLHEVYETPDDMYLVMEICTGGSLQDQALTASGQPAYSHEQVAIIIRNVTSAVAYLHDIGIIHRDLKLDNVMLKAKRSLDVKICDFGLAAVQWKESHMQQVCGTPSYMAPEILANQGSYSPLCDVWSLGVMLFLLLSGSLPFKRQSADESQLGCIKRTKLSFEDRIWNNVDDSVKRTIGRLLQMDPADRVTAKELLDDPWVDGRGVVGAGSSGVMTVIEMMRMAAAEQQAEMVPDVPKSPVVADIPGARGRGSPLLDLNSICDRIAKTGDSSSGKKARIPSRAKLTPMKTSPGIHSKTARRPGSGSNRRGAKPSPTKPLRPVPGYMRTTSSSRGNKTKGDLATDKPARVLKARLPPIAQSSKDF